MNEALSIAATALNAATTEIAVTSENLANAQTPGYATQRAELAPLPGGDAPGVGNGVQVTSIGQVTNALLSANNLQAQGALQALTASQQVLTAIQDVFPLGQSAPASSTQGSTNTSIAGQLANFWNSFDAIAQDPSALAPRSQVVDQAQGLATSLNEAATQLSQLATNTVGQLQGQLGQVNGLLQQAAQLNEQIVATQGGGGSPNQLVDQLNQVTSQLGQLAGVSVQDQANGTVFVSINGIGVVQGNVATTLQLTTTTGTSPGVTSATVTTSAGTPVLLTSGSMAGLLSALGSQGSIAQYQGQLDQVASNLATIVNTQLEAGFTATGASGSALFNPGGGPINASTISVNPAIVADPSLLAASSTSNPSAAANDGSNAQVLAEFATQPSVNVPVGSATPTSVQMPDTTYQTLIENIGSATQAINSQVASQTSVANQAQQALQAVTGVNQNTELTNLIQQQSAYEASAKLVSVISATVQSLLQAV
jgi:flagellar hook-associated protein 1 FlgK